MGPLARPLFFLAAAAICCGAPAEPVQRTPNVLFVAFDDLNDWIKPLDPDAPIAMPNMERLAQRGVLFRRAYCATPECNPSRTAVLSGLRPTTSGVYANNADWKRAIPDAVMLPRYFREQGYRSAGAGKIYHHVAPYFHDDGSFERYLPFLTDRLPGNKLNGLTRALTADGLEEPLHPTFDWGPSPTPEPEMLDTRSADFAIDFLQERQDRPFFLAVGFFRPHLPYFTPERVLDRYAPDEMPLPPLQPDDLADVPAGAHTLMKRWRRMFHGIAQAPQPEAKWREAIAAYAAGATFADEQFGRILDALDASPHRDNTVIVVWSDHGYHLGEKEHWTKFVLWEKATRVPLIVVAPQVARAGAVCDRPVSLVDLYPTLVELCGLPEKSNLDGASLVSLLRDPSASRDRPAVMTEMRGNHAVRSDRWRYIRYADGGEELYDHVSDPHEWTNLAARPEFEDVLSHHRRFLPVSEAAVASDYPPGT